MCSRCSAAVLLVAMAGLVCRAEPRRLRVCADPDNLPYSNRRGEGFENRIAEMAARDLGATLEYVWWSQRKSFVKNTLNAGLCDAILGLPSGFPGVAATRPYYSSAYLFVTRKDGPAIASFDDPRLKTLRIGLHIAGNDYAPPGFALARRGIVDNVRGYSLFDDRGPGALLDALARGEVDVAIVWGPIAGYWAHTHALPLDMLPAAGDAAVPLSYSISAAVRPPDDALRRELDGVLERHGGAIRALLEEYGVPQVR